MSPIDSRRARIVATVGPASSSLETLRGMVAAGMDVARINCSHGDAEVHARAIAMVREAAADADRPVAILLDLPGPKLRVAKAAPPVTVLPGDRLDLVSARSWSPDMTDRLPVTGDLLRCGVQPGDRVLVDDGRITLRAVATDDDHIEVEATESGEILPGKGVNLPDTTIPLELPTDRDLPWIEFAAEHAVDWVAISFVQSPGDVSRVRQALREAGSHAAVCAKIERRAAIDAADDIVAVANAIMVARGDLGVECDLASIPALQKRLIETAAAHRRIVITATEMLESMTYAPRPTRAEVSDVATAIDDGTDAVMLSGETAIGVDPVRTIAMMGRVVEAAEDAGYAAPVPGSIAPSPERPFASALVDASVTVASALDASLIVVVTETGGSAQLLAKARPSVPLVALTSNETTWRRLALCWGTRPLTVKRPQSTDELLRLVRKTVLDEGMAEPDDLVVVLSGPANETGGTDLLKVIRV